MAIDIGQIIIPVFKEKKMEVVKESIGEKLERSSKIKTFKYKHGFSASGTVGVPLS
jgi:hypothetical protein